MLSFSVDSTPVFCTLPPAGRIDERHTSGGRWKVPSLGWLKTNLKEYDVITSIRIKAVGGDDPTIPRGWSDLWYGAFRKQRC